MEGKPVGEPTQVVSKFKLPTKAESTGHWLEEDHARIWEVLKTEEGKIDESEEAGAGERRAYKQVIPRKGKSSIQDWGEEVEEGAVYHVTLKRVQIQQAANKGARVVEENIGSEEHIYFRCNLTLDIAHLVKDLSKVEGDQLPPGHTVSQYETCKIRTIKAGTLEKLVENLLTAFGDNDFTYISIFLSTYRGFASTKEVLELLLDRYGNLTSPNCEEDGSQNSPESRTVIRK
ncbi:Ral guanine nucleotide dissociation stimulator-like 1 [Myotis brandtii]|uniref:Ral guanine nucleotide dissociation stimulator-like 1 n=1 Tax=Myotis brandtii TaxID=109478 RepID=S7Q896_MYOBR|nr:Ral guanine nucleotide dissociation stimulator-like 1 [Myotis brandtii]